MKWNEKLWKKYGEVRAESLRVHGDMREATAFYEANRARGGYECDPAQWGLVTGQGLVTILAAIKEWLAELQLK